MEGIDAANNDEAVEVCEYYTLRWYRWGPEGHASKDCLRLFTSRETAEHANELSALEASKRYYWPYSHAEPWEEVNGSGERIFKYSGETYQKIFTVHKTNALVIQHDRMSSTKNNNDANDSTDLRENQTAYGIITNGLIGGHGLQECVFVGMNDELIRSTAMSRARDFAQLLLTKDSGDFCEWCGEIDADCHYEDILVLREGPRPSRRPQQDGSDACLILRIETAVNPNYDYEADGYENYAENYYSETLATVKVMKMLVGTPSEEEYANKEFYNEWTGFPSLPTAEMVRLNDIRQAELRRQLEENIRREREEQDIPIPLWRQQLNELMDSYRAGENSNEDESNDANAQDGG
jgi:hypothetical protein